MPQRNVNPGHKSLSKFKLLILGAGYSGQAIARFGKSAGYEIICSRRDIGKEGTDIVFNSSKLQIPNFNDLNDITHLISCIPPDENGKDPVLDLLEENLKILPLQWVGYLSTTGVYGDYGGNWVTEENATKPEQARSKRRLSCEKAWLESGLPIQILRLPGIYGPGRSAVDGLKKGQSKMIDKPGQVFSRIHVDDIAGALFHLIILADNGIMPKIVNIADSLPSSNLEVLKYAASLIGKTLPPIESFETAKKNMSPMALSFWQENRKVSNELLCNKLGYKLLYPTYKSGLQSCIKENQLN